MKIYEGTWVQIQQIVLQPKERAPQLPEDTKLVPLELRVNGFLQEDADLGEEVKIITLIGRQLTGRLSCVEPRYPHNFGRPIPALLTIGQELRHLLFEEGQDK